MSNVRPSTNEGRRDDAAAVGARIKEAMDRLGWASGPSDKRVYDVQRLADAVSELSSKEGGVRWQTVQQWVEGNAVPGNRHGYGRAVAQVLEMTLDELLGVIADGDEPPFEAWRQFLETPEGRSMTRVERDNLARIYWTTTPSVSAYRVVLAGLRTPG